MKSVRLPKSAVKTSIVRHDEDPERLVLDPTCPICAVDMGTKSPEGIRESYAVTPCGHVFGNVCIKKYLAITDKPMCPVCRTDLFHACSHPVLPSPYDPKKSRLSRDEAAAKAFPDEPRHTDCKFCRHRKIKHARRMRRQEVLEAAARKSGGGGGGSGGSGSSEGGDSDDSESPGGSPGGATRGLRLALQIVHITAALARLTLDAARIRKIKVPPEDEGSDAADYNEDGELEGDIILPSSPRLPANHGLPPVPGPYGHWDLANKGPDWKFLGWYDQQEPRMKTKAEHFS